MQPLVSVIISTYNRSEYLISSLNSILNQDYKNLEVLVVNDCSTDNTDEVLNSIIDDRIIVFNNTSQNGLTRNLNFLLKKARGTYIARMDDDDICLPSRISKQVSKVQSSGAHIVCSNISYMTEFGEHICNRAQQNLDESLNKLPRHNPIAHPTVLFKRDAIIQAGGYDNTYITGQDGELWTRLRNLKFIFVQIDEPLVAMRIHPQSITSRRLNYTDPNFTYAKVCLINNEKLKAVKYIRKTKTTGLKVALFARLIAGESLVSLAKHIKTSLEYRKT